MTLPSRVLPPTTFAAVPSSAGGAEVMTRRGRRRCPSPVGPNKATRTARKGPTAPNQVAAVSVSSSPVPDHGGSSALVGEGTTSPSLARHRRVSGIVEPSSRTQVDRDRSLTSSGRGSALTDRHGYDDAWLGRRLRRAGWPP